MRFSQSFQKYLTRQTVSQLMFATRITASSSARVSNSLSCLNSTSTSLSISFNASPLTAFSRPLATNVNNTTNILSTQQSTSSLTNPPPTNTTTTTSPAHRVPFSPDELSAAVDDSEDDPARGVLLRHDDYKQRLQAEEQQQMKIEQENLQLKKKSSARDYGYTSDRYIRAYLYQTLREHAKLEVNPHPVLGSSFKDLTPTQFDAITFNDLQLDSLDRVEVLVSVEKRFDVEVSDDIYFNLKNLGELVDTLMDIPDILLPSYEPPERDPQFLRDEEDERTRVH